MTVLDRFYAVIYPAFGAVPVIWANQDGPRPAGLYATLRLDGVAHRTPLIVGMQDDAGVRINSAHRTGTIEVQAFGSGAFDLLDTVGQLLMQQDAIDRANTQDLALGPMGDVTDEPALRDMHQWEPRAIASLPYAYTGQTDEALSWIETVEGTIDVDGATAIDPPPMPYSVTIVDNPSP